MILRPVDVLAWRFRQEKNPKHDANAGDTCAKPPSEHYCGSTWHSEICIRTVFFGKFQSSDSDWRIDN